MTTLNSKDEEQEYYPMGFNEMDAAAHQQFISFLARRKVNNLCCMWLMCRLMSEWARLFSVLGPSMSQA
jgi:hypothetical protein